VSLRMLTLAWGTLTGGIQKLVLVALADYADDQGGSVFPAVATLARKCGIDETTCRRALRGLEEDGLIVVVAEARQHRPREYRMQLRAGNAPPLDVSRAGAAHARAGAEPIQGRRSAPQSVNDPSMNQEGVAVADSEQGPKTASEARAAFEALLQETTSRMPRVGAERASRRGDESGPPMREGAVEERPRTDRVGMLSRRIATRTGRQ
jgi:pyocin large subunit-like protein